MGWNGKISSSGGTMYRTLSIIAIIVILAFWWKLRSGKKVKVDPPSKLKELNTWQEM